MGAMYKLREKVIMLQGISALSKYAIVQHLCVLPIWEVNIFAWAQAPKALSGDL